MTRTFFASELETAATYWRVFRRDGVAHAFCTHDRDLYFGGILHRSAPGMLPAAIRLTSHVSDHGTEVTGALDHSTIRDEDLARGRFDHARIEIGIVDWQSLAHSALYSGKLGSVTREAGRFTAQIHSAKAQLDIDDIPRSSPSCRARFCGAGCTLSAESFSHRATLVAIDLDTGVLSFDVVSPQLFGYGEVRWLDGPHTGQRMRILDASGQGMQLDRALDPGVTVGMRAILREGCDHTIATCSARFGNAVNFQGEPFLPGNDLLTSYPRPK